MATLTVRDLEDGLVQQLHIRAAEHGRSVEAELREILRAALAGTLAVRRQEAVSRLAAFRQRTAGRGMPAASDLPGGSADRTDSIPGRPRHVTEPRRPCLSGPEMDTRQTGQPLGGASGPQ